MWDLPRPGLEPVSPALAGRLSTTAPPGKPLIAVFEIQTQLCAHFMEDARNSKGYGQHSNSSDRGLFWGAVGGSVSHRFSLSSCPSKSHVEATVFSSHPEQPLCGWPQCSTASTQTQSASRKTGQKARCAEKVNSCLLRMRGLKKALASSWQLSALDDYLHDFICS